jgi:methyltransferase (TIGR00027 family)
MKDDSPSMTAAWVAHARSLGAFLPEEGRIADDPYGARFATAAMRALTTFGIPPPLLPFILYMQLRTRAIDDVLRRFIQDEKGTQVLLLGAGFDCRAARFQHELRQANATVFEVDHPATQKVKRAALVGAPSAEVRYLAWNFEDRATSELPKALAAAGHDAEKKTLTIWEGVTMYLTEPAIEATVGAVRTLSAPSSPFVITWFEESLVTKPKPLERFMKIVVSQVGEPFRFGWTPSEFAPWMEKRGLTVESDKDASSLAHELLPSSLAQKLDRYAAHRHVAVTRT